jgi:outer membrane biosynthesis protein TonB
MQTCLSCRAALREFRALPQRVASIVPPAAFVASGAGSPVRTLLESIVGAAQHKTAAMGDRLHAAAELATGQKVAAVAASAAALAGGGNAIDEFANHGGRQPAAAVQPAGATPTESPGRLEAEQPPPVVTDAPAPEPDRTLQANPAPADAPAPAPPPPPDPANEFEPTPAPAPAPEPAPAPTPGGFETASRGGSGYASGGGNGEFAP